MNASDSLVALGQSVPVLAIQSTLLLWMALAAGFFLRKRGAAAQALAYRAALVGVLALGIPYLTGVRKYSGLTRFPPPNAATAIPMPRPEMEPHPAALGADPKVQVLPAVTRLDAYTVGSVAGWIGTAWVVVGGVILLWTFGCHAFLLLLRRRCRPVDDFQTKLLLAELSSLTNTPRPLLLTGDWVRGPFLDALVRPAILLPTTYRTDFPGEALRAVLAHELVHLARRDCWWNLVSRVICALGWMQPLLWLVYRRLEQASEEACDQEVLHHGLSARDYARCLTDLAERLLPNIPARVAGATVLPFRSGLGRRVERILNHTGARSTPGGGMRVGVWVGATAAVCMVTGTVSTMPPAQGSEVEIPKGSLVGRVVHADGRPARKVKLVALVPPQPERRRLGDFGFAMTDANGAYRFQGLNDGVYTIFRTRPSLEWAGAAVTATAREGTPGQAPEITLTPGGLIRGRVQDDAGKPMEGVYVRSHGPDRPDTDSSFGNVMTDANGRFQLRVSPGKTVMSVIGPVDRVAFPGPGNPPVRKVAVEVALGETLDVDLRADGKLYAAGAITGRVSFPDGRPAAGIRVMAQLNDSHYDGSSGRSSDGAFSWSEDISRADGTYRLTGLTSASYNVSVEDPTDQWIAPAQERVATEQRRTISSPALVLTRGGIVTGTVTDEATGKPLANVSVATYGPHRPRSSAMVMSSLTDAAGRYRLRVAPGGSYIYVMDSRHGAGLSADVTLAEGDTRELPFRVRALPPDID